MTEADKIESLIDRAKFWRELNLQVQSNYSPATGRKHEIIETDNVYEWTYYQSQRLTYSCTYSINIY
ncbi:MAG: hypothetical protein QNJ65_02985 [Xenococcaceae cyanobacterium MO_234.B1]|nr:hypothetical protein [Xenococcaceae cyanobacterium MO_234.B1]